MKILKEYSIKASTVEDALENWVWTNDETANGFIRINNPTNNKSITVFKRTIDENFIKFYNSKRTKNITDNEKPLIVINEHYRNDLGIEQNKVYKLKIKKAGFIDIHINSNWKHPNHTVSQSYKTSIISLFISLFLGLISIILGVMSLIVTCK